MKTLLDCALELAALGFHVFPVKAGQKQPPMVKEFWNRATTDPEEIRRLWRYDEALESGDSFNPAISTTRFMEGSLLVLDVDPKHGGDYTLDDFAVIRGYHLPDTYEQRSPSGGTHYFYRIPEPCALSVGALGPGLDIRSYHGYVLGAGSQTSQGVYTNCVRPVADAPDWLSNWALAHPARGEARDSGQRLVSVDRRAALRRAHDFLDGLPSAPDGQRDAEAFKAAATLREFGLSEEDATEQMLLWFKADPGTHALDIEHAVQSAYKYAKGQAGGLTAGAHFQPLPPIEAPEPAPPPEKPATPQPPPDEPGASGDPRHLLNLDHAAVMVGNKFRVMWEFPGPWGQPTREFLAIEDFYNRHAGVLMPSPDGEKKVEVAKQWVKWRYRRSYDGVVFAPGQELTPNFYNTWKGFAYEPLARGEKPTDDMKEALEMFKTHTLVNLAGEDQRLYTWLMNFAAHSVQHPDKKPLVAVVFKGSRGNGKSSWAQRIGALHEPHLFVASDQRYLVGNFNGHMAETTWFVLEEAFWGGSKSAEGVLKELVTGEKLTIEQKFREAFRARNYMRIVIIGNEDWQVPAALKDERRWAVFTADMRLMPMKTVADKKKVRRFFERMRVLMEGGGYRYLLSHLLSIDLEDADVNEAPLTDGLIEQIEHTLSPLHQWWLECLRDGRIVQGDFPAGQWPEDVEKARLRAACKRYLDDQNIGSRCPTPTTFGRELRRVCPNMILDKKNADNQWIYRLPSLPVARADWEKTIGKATVWPDSEEF